MQSTSVSLNTLESKNDAYYTKTYNELINSFLTEMDIVSPLFKEFHKRESYMENLEILIPDIFDLLVGVLLPCSLNKNEMKVVSTTQRSCYLTLEIFKGLNDLREQKDTYHELEQLMDNEGNLLQDKIHDWLECIVYKAQENYSKNYRPNGSTYSLDVDEKNAVVLLGAFFSQTVTLRMADKAIIEFNMACYTRKNP